MLYKGSPQSDTAPLDWTPPTVSRWIKDIMSLFQLEKKKLDICLKGSIQSFERTCTRKINKKCWTWSTSSFTAFWLNFKEKYFWQSSQTSTNWQQESNKFCRITSPYQTDLLSDTFCHENSNTEVIELFQWQPHSFGRYTAIPILLFYFIFFLCSFLCFYDFMLVTLSFTVQ